MNAESMEACTPSTIPCPMHLFPLDPLLYHFIVHAGISLSCVSHSSKLPNLRRKPVRSTGDNLDLTLASEREGSNLWD